MDLDVPANAEFILEGYVDPTEDWVIEGPFGDHTGFYTLPDLYPLFHVTAITMRRSPVYPATIVGRPPMEDAYLIEASERLFLPAAQLILPEIVDYHMPPAGVAHNLVFVSIKKGYPGQAYKVANGLFGLGQMMFAKVIVVVDEDVPVSDFAGVWREVAARAVPGRDTLTTRGPTDVLDHSSSRGWGYGGKLIIDATTKSPEETGGAESSRDLELDGPALEEAFRPHAAAEVPDFGGVVAQRQTDDGYWLVALHKTRPGQAAGVGPGLRRPPRRHGRPASADLRRTHRRAQPPGCVVDHPQQHRPGKGRASGRCPARLGRRTQIARGRLCSSLATQDRDGRGGGRPGRRAVAGLRPAGTLALRRFWPGRYAGRATGVDRMAGEAYSSLRPRRGAKAKSRKASLGRMKIWC